MKQLLVFTSLKQKLRAVIMATTAIVLSVVTLSFVVNEAVTYRRAMREELTALANIIGQNAAAAITFGDQKSAIMTLQSVSAKPHIKSAVIFLPDGALFASYGSPGEALARVMPPVSGPRRSAADSRTALAEFRRHAEQAWTLDGDEDVVVPVHLEGQEIGVVAINSSLVDLYDRFRGFFALVVVITLLAMGTAFVVATRLQRPIIEPILQLVNTTKAVADSRDYSARVARQSSDEIGQLVDGFNEMLSQIQKRDAHLERYAAELQDGNEELKGFIYSVAHDLRAPLVNIRGFTGELGRAAREIQEIVEKQAENLPEEIRHRTAALVREDVQPATGFIGASVERMSGLINALLKLSQLGHRQLRLEPLDLREMAQMSLRSLQHQVNEKNAVVEVGVLPEATADRLAMEQVITNLLDNALKYLSPGRPGRILISSRQTAEGTVYFVQDNGRGIDANDMPKLFKIFRRLGSPDVPGEGVGLAYVKTLVKRHGGRIWCESEPGRGSIFFFSIPQHEVRQPVSNA